jgi:hypothetical protein
MVERGHQLGVDVPAVSRLDELSHDVFEGQFFIRVSGEEAQH